MKLNKKNKKYMYIAIASIVALIIGGFIGTIAFDKTVDGFRLNWDYQTYLTNAQDCTEELRTVLDFTEDNLNSRGFYFDEYNNAKDYMDCHLGFNIIGEGKCSCTVRGSLK